MVTISNGVLTARIAETGAQLCSLVMGGTDYLWGGNPDIWAKHSPVLFPFVGRLPDQKYVFRGREYGPMPLHGFVPTSQFVAEEVSSSSCTMRLIVTDAIREIYPFDFVFRVKYELSDNTIRYTYMPSNNGSDDMFYGIGSHPGFNVPFSSGYRFEDYYVEFPDAGDVVRKTFTDKGLDSGTTVPYKLHDKRLHLSHELLDNEAICLGNSGHTAIIKSDSDPRSITVGYPDTPWCSVWQKPHLKAPFICIEPWFSLPGTDGTCDIEKRKDFFRLKPACKARHELTITISG